MIYLSKYILLNCGNNAFCIKKHFKVIKDNNDVRKWSTANQKLQTQVARYRLGNSGYNKLKVLGVS